MRREEENRGGETETNQTEAEEEKILAAVGRPKNAFQTFAGITSDAANPQKRIFPSKKGVFAPRKECHMNENILPPFSEKNHLPIKPLNEEKDTLQNSITTFFRRPWGFSPDFNGYFYPLRCSPPPS